MKRFKVLGVGLLAVCALSLVAMPVSAAWAKGKDVLQLNEGETKAGSEAPTYFAIEIAGNCFSRNNGHLTGNDAATVTAVTTENVDECGYGSELTGSIEKVSLSSKGKLTLTGSLTLTTEIGEEEGPCKYVFSKWKLTSKVPGPVEFSGRVSGKRVKAGSNKDCPPTANEEVNIGLSPAADHAAYFDAALVP